VVNVGFNSARVALLEILVIRTLAGNLTALDIPDCYRVHGSRKGVGHRLGVWLGIIGAKELSDRW
jgi:hypothetical protein